MAWPLAHERFDVLSFLGPAAWADDVVWPEARGQALAGEAPPSLCGPRSAARQDAELVVTVAADAADAWCVHAWPTLLAAGLSQPAVEEDLAPLWARGTAVPRSLALVGVPGALHLTATAVAADDAPGAAALWPRVRLGWRHPRPAVVAAVREAVLHRLARVLETAAAQASAAALDEVGNATAIVRATALLAVCESDDGVPPATRTAATDALARSGVWTLPSSLLPPSAAL